MLLFFIKQYKCVCFIVNYTGLTLNRIFLGRCVMLHMHTDLVYSDEHFFLSEEALLTYALAEVNIVFQLLTKPQK